MRRNNKRSLMIKEELTNQPVEALNDVLKVMYNSAIELQEIQGDFSGTFSRVALMGMSADISELLKRFRKITAAIKTGDDERVKIALGEARLRSLINELIFEQISKKKF